MVLGVPRVGGQAKAYLAGMVILGAQGNDVSSIAPGIGNTYYTVSSTEEGEVILTASNAAGNDQYLRKDGSVLPSAMFDWNNQSITNIQEMSVNDKVTAANVEVTDNLKLTRNSVVRQPCEANSIGLDVKGNLLTCQSGLWQATTGSGAGSVGVIRGDWRGVCGTISAPENTSIYTHDIVYYWTHMANPGPSDYGFTTSGSGYLVTESVNICGYDESPVGGSWVAVAVPKKT